MLFHVTALEAELLTLVVASTTPLIVTMICVFIVHARHFAVAYSIALIKASILVRADDTYNLRIYELGDPR